MSYSGKTPILKSNPYGNNFYSYDRSDYGDPPPTPNVKRMVTEDGKFMVTEDSNFMVTEG